MNFKFQFLLRDIFAIFGIFFFLVIIHEIVHFIDGYGPNIAVCFGFLNVHRFAFVVNGDNYTLFRGELLAYGITLIVALIIFWLMFKRDDKNG